MMGKNSNFNYLLNLVPLKKTKKQPETIWNSNTCGLPQYSFFNIVPKRNLLSKAYVSHWVLDTFCFHSSPHTNSQYLQAALHSQQSPPTAAAKTREKKEKHIS